MSQDKPGVNLIDIDTDWQEVDFHCITCSDEAVRVTVASVNNERSIAQVTEGGLTEEVDISLVDAVSPGDVLLAHGGVALANLGRVEIK